MSILQKLGDLFRSWFPPSLHPGLGDPGLSSLMTTLKSLTSSTDAIRILNGKSFGTIVNPSFVHLRQGQWEERAIYCKTVTSLPKSEELFQVLSDWCAQEPKSALPFLIRGAFLLDWGWEARGSGTSDTVTESGEQLMEERLIAAKKDLLLAAKLDPEDPTPYMYLIDTVKGLGVESNSIEEYFQKGLPLDPENFSLHNSMLTVLTEKWYGSHEVMFQFAKDSIAHAKPESLLPALLYKAHIERWLYPVLSLAGISEKYMTPEQKISWQQALAYPKDQEVRKETLEAYQQLRQAEGNHSQLALAVPKNLAAFWFYLAQEKEPLKVLLSELGPQQITEYPWVYDGGIPMLTYRKAKKLASL